MENSIDFFFNPLFIEGTEYVLKNVRQVYPSNISKIFVWIDDDYFLKNEIISIAKKYEATIVVSMNKFTWCSPSRPDESRLRLIEFCRRFQKTAGLSTARWIMYLEDDVLVRDKIVNFPNTDMGINPGNVASGGSIHLTECISGIFEKYSDDDLLKIMQPFPFYFAADRLLLKLCSECNYTYSVFSDLSDGVPPERSNKPILHNIKTHYPSKWKEYRLYLNGNLEINPLL
jgi:hypothetical protein